MLSNSLRMFPRLISALFLLIGSLTLSAQTESFDLVTYNLMFYKTTNAPCSHIRNAALRDADLTTIVDYLTPEILVVNELGDNPVNPPIMLRDILNVNGRNYYEQATTTNNSSSGLVNMLFYNSDVLALHSQQTLQRDLGGTPILRVIDFYRLYVKDPGLGQPGVDTVFFTVVALHFKAGSSSGDRSQRERAAEAIIDFIDRNVQDDHVILAGDLNIRSSSEDAYQELINPSNPLLSLNDPLSRPGNWNNNPNFSTVHTQSTRSNGAGCFSGGGMDDRFDQILVSNQILANSNLDYVEYRTIGQDGGSYNNNLATSNNISVPANVATALFNFSDHLPVGITLEAEVSGLGIEEAQLWQQSIAFPNPFRDELTVSFEGMKAHSAMSLNVLDLTGRSIAKLDFSVGESLENLSFNSGGWPNGIYLLSLIENGQPLLTRKIVKQ